MSMKTPDTECKCELDGFQGAVSAEHCKVHGDTPDTEWALKSVENIVSEIRSRIRKKYTYVGLNQADQLDTKWNSLGMTADWVIDAFCEDFSKALTSRDTYWKERVEAVRRDLKARMAHQDYIECVTCDETLYHLDTLLDNLK